MKNIFSGIQPTGNLHIGNYLGAMKQWVELQNNSDYKNIFCIVDLHAITVPQDPKKLNEQIYSTMAMLLAVGLDPKKSILFVQSHRHEHSELAWILNTLTYMGELERMTQYKDKSLRTTTSHNESPSIGLFDYPVLMAADILLYNTDLVPVGEDQTQHVELARDIAKRFNNKFGETFHIPQPLIQKNGARIMGLDDPTKKMSKSAPSEYNFIALTDDAETIKRKISKAVTDSGKTIEFDEKRPGLYNLLTIFQLFSEKTPTEIEKQFAGLGYGDFKKALADLLIEKLSPIQEKYNKLMKNKKYLDKVYADGNKRAEKITKKMLEGVKNKIGLIK
jgi:tryptophanyl-tRNA synthetase